MLTADPPAIVAPADDGPVIEVVATRPDQAQKIDRRIYRVKDNALAAQSDTLQLLRGLPAVVVTPDDQLLLLGSAGVTILIDERPYQGDAVQYLRTLHGSDIERIEIITNPSAQYAAQGTGGIINIVLRKKRSDGVSGSGSVLLSSFGRGEGSATWKRKKGKWTYELQAQATAGNFAFSRFRKLRMVENADGTITINTAAGTGESNYATVYGSGRASYDLTPQTTLSATVGGDGTHSKSVNDTAYIGLTPDFTSFSEDQVSRRDDNFAYFQLDYDHKGKVDGETLKGSFSVFEANTHPRLDGQYNIGGGYSSDSRARQAHANGQIDWVHPIGKDHILSLGIGIDADQSHRSQETIFLGDEDFPDIDGFDSYRTRNTLVAGYVTYQFRSGKWTLLPGVRVEDFSRSISGPGANALAPLSIETHQTSVFPTFHLDRPLGKDVSLSFSYANRIDRPDPTQLRPYNYFLGALAIQRGNPTLRDQKTKSYETNLHYHHKTIDLGAILYDRETSNLWANSYSVDAQGNSVGMFVNSGHKSDRGAEIDLTLPLARRLKGTASVNLFDSVVPIDQTVGSSRLAQFRYTANATIDWQGKDKSKRPGDVGQVQIVYESPARTYQTRNSASISATLSYTHSLSRSVALTGSVENIGARHSSHRLEAPTVQEDYDQWQRQPEVKLKLVKTLGTGKT